MKKILSLILLLGALGSVQASSQFPGIPMILKSKYGEANFSPQKKQLIVTYKNVRSVAPDENGNFAITTGEYYGDKILTAGTLPEKTIMPQYNRGARTFTITYENVTAADDDIEGNIDVRFTDGKKVKVGFLT